jgi:hypothetical protein
VEWRSNQVKAEKPLPHPNRATKRVKAELEIHMHHSFQSQNVHAGVILAFQFEMDLHATGQGAGMFFNFFFCAKNGGGMLMLLLTQNIIANQFYQDSSCIKIIFFFC